MASPFFFVKKKDGKLRPCQDYRYLSGFHQVALWSGPNGLRLQGLKEYFDSYSAPDYLGPVLGSKCLVMQTLDNYLGLGPSEETSESMFQVATQTFNLLYCFPFMLLIGLTSLASIYSQTPVSVLKSTSFTPSSFPQSFLSIPDLSSPSEIRTFRCYEGTAHKLRPSPFGIHLRSPESATLLLEPNNT
jgi:hypothetical protein